jgi:glucosamine--fructose-6-phosphate aminotransferase (isomerizing)
MSREVDGVFFTSAGPEIGVAATKSFSTQLMVFLLWAGYLAQKNKTDFNQKLKTQLLFQSIVHLPHLIKDCLELDSPMMIAVKRVAKSIVNSSGLFFIGRGFSYPLALEGSLKVKEISYIHAEGYAAGELKHGPIAMIDNTMSVVVLAPTDAWRDKTVSNLQEVKARGAKIIGVGGAHDLALKEQCDEYIPLPISFVKSGESSGLDESLVPFILGPVVQLLSYELAVLKGTDVDKPRNLAKSVTVE